MCAKDRSMTLDEYNSFCGSLPFATHVVQWGGAHVWKVGCLTQLRCDRVTRVLLPVLLDRDQLVLESQPGRLPP
jgi:hypothetical protein